MDNLDNPAGKTDRFVQKERESGQTQTGLLERSICPKPAFQDKKAFTKVERLIENKTDRFSMAFAFKLEV